MVDFFRLNLPDPFSPLALPRTPGPLGCGDAADPSCSGHLGFSPGALGINDFAAIRANPAFAVTSEYLLRHRRTKNQLVEAVCLDSAIVKVPRLKATIWELNQAVIYRLRDIKHDYDGAPDAYHPPTANAWDGKGPGLGRDSLVNAVGKPGWPRTGTAAERYAKWKLTSGCAFLTEYYRAKKLHSLPNASPAEKQELDKILSKYKVQTFQELEAQKPGKICVKFIPGRPTDESIRDWCHVEHWAGIVTDKHGQPIVKTDGQYQGYYVPRIIPHWANPYEHPWLVRNPLLGQKFNLRHGDYVVIVSNGETPTIAYGIIADSGPEQGLGECSQAMTAQLGPRPSRGRRADYIFLQFPGTGDAQHERSGKEFRELVKKHFDSWYVDGRFGIDAVKELFPDLETYDRLWNACFPKLKLTHQWRK